MRPLGGEKPRVPSSVDLLSPSGQILFLSFAHLNPLTGEGNGKPLQYSCLENPMNSMKRQKDRTLKDELSRSVGAQYATGELERTLMLGKLGAGGEGDDRG